MESTAEAGEIVLSVEAAARVPESVLGAPKGEGVILGADPKPAPRPEPFPDPAGIDLERIVPGPVRRVLATGAVEPEHRQAVIGFLHFGGVDALSPGEAGPRDRGARPGRSGCRR